MRSWRRPLFEWSSPLWITKTTDTSRLSPAVIWSCRQDRLLRMGLRSSWSPLCLFLLPIHNSRSTPTIATPATSTSSASTVTATSAPRPRTRWAAPAARARWTCPMMRAVHGGARSSQAPSDTSSTRGIDWADPRCRSSRKSTTFWSVPPVGNASFTTSQCKWRRNCENKFLQINYILKGPETKLELFILMLWWSFQQFGHRCLTLTSNLISLIKQKMSSYAHKYARAKWLKNFSVPRERS